MNFVPHRLKPIWKKETGIEVEYITGSSGGVELVYQVSADSVTWYTPSSPALLTQGTTGTAAAAFDLMTSPYVRFKTNVTGTTQYNCIVFGR